MNAIFDTDMISPTFIFVDGSYYCFYRYYALLNWWKNAYPDEKLDDPFQNDIFVEKFRKTFVDNLINIPKKLKLHKSTQKPVLIVGKDCKRENIWRKKIYENYKANRNNSAEDGFMGGPFFKMAYEEGLFYKGQAKYILSYPTLEADDCIALSVKFVVNKYPDANIYIITSDRDYLQLNYPNVHIYNLAFKELGKSKNDTGDPYTDLKIKIIMGDNSDNIPSVFPKCGFKTALKCINDDAFFKIKMKDNEDYYNQYNLNETLIDFNKIPDDLKNGFINEIIYEKRVA